MMPVDCAAAGIASVLKSSNITGTAFRKLDQKYPRPHAQKFMASSKPGSSQPFVVSSSESSKGSIRTEVHQPLLFLLARPFVVTGDIEVADFVVGRRAVPRVPLRVDKEFAQGHTWYGTPANNKVGYFYI